MPERGTIANMGAEMGAATSIFPSDEAVRKFFASQGREKDFVELCADEDCTYDDEITIDLSALEPLIACPDMPDNVKPPEQKYSRYILEAVQTPPIRISKKRL